MQFSSFAILLATIFIIETQAFCIYNFLDEGGSFNVNDAIYSEKPGSFSKTLAAGTKECCHFENGDCNITRKSEKDVFFQIKFEFNKDGRILDTPTYLTKCTGGGALAFYGSATDYYGLCTPAGKPTYQALLDKDPIYPLTLYL